MEETMSALVIPALQALDLRYVVNGEAVCLDFRGAPAAYHLCLRVVAEPELLWLHFIPSLWVEASSTAVLELLLALNHGEWQLKCSRHPADGEVAFDAELPLYDGLTPEYVGEYVMGACLCVSALLPLILKVQWGGLSVAEAIALRAGGSAEPAALPATRAEQEALEIVQQLEQDHGSADS